ncbi:hypothetical protein D9M68_918020 [compost metagenome]
MALSQRGVDEAAGGNVDLAQRQHVFAAHHGREAFAADEVLVPGQGRRESVGFVLEASNQNVHDGFPVGWTSGAGGRGPGRAVHEQEQGPGHQQGGNHVQAASQRARGCLGPADDRWAEESAQQADAVDEGDAAGRRLSFQVL